MLALQRLAIVVINAAIINVTAVKSIARGLLGVSGIDGVEAVQFVVDLQVLDATSVALIGGQEVLGVQEEPGTSEQNGLSKRDPGEEALRSAFFVFSAVELKPDSPIMPKNCQTVPTT